MAQLLVDPSSRLQAAISGWKQPVSQEWILSADLYDLLLTVNSKRKPTPYPRPWPSAGKSRIGSSKDRTRDDIIRALNRMNPRKE